jgi:hypothetical protein
MKSKKSSKAKLFFWAEKDVFLRLQFFSQVQFVLLAKSLEKVFAFYLELLIFQRF